MPIVTRWVRNASTGWVLLAALVMTGCGGEAGPDPDPEGPGPGSGTLSIASVSPAQPYWDDTLTITGTGFSTTAAGNTVTFSDRTGIGAPLISGKVVSASATRLRVALDWAFPQKALAQARVFVQVGSSKDSLAALVSFRGVPHVFDIDNPEDPGYGWPRPGDSLEVLVFGVNPVLESNSLTTSRGGISGSIYQSSTPVLVSKLATRLPVTFVGHPEGFSSRNDTTHVTFIWSDGTRSDTVVQPVYGVPAMSAHMVGKQSFSSALLNDPNTVSGDRTITIVGKNMYGPGYVRFASPDPQHLSDNRDSPVTFSGMFSDSVAVLVPQDLVAGSYNVELRITAFSEAEPDRYLLLPVTITP
jgi:hypothetical protein